jgi:hypothetical protein
MSALVVETHSVNEQFSNIRARESKASLRQHSQGVGWICAACRNRRLLHLRANAAPESRKLVLF